MYVVAFVKEKNQTNERNRKKKHQRNPNERKANLKKNQRLVLPRDGKREREKDRKADQLNMRKNSNQQVVN